MSVLVSLSTCVSVPSSVHLMVLKLLYKGTQVLKLKYIIVLKAKLFAK